MKKKLFYKLEFDNAVMEFTETFCRDLSGVLHFLKMEENGLAEINPEIPTSVIITGVYMTENAYRKWCEENEVGYEYHVFGNAE